MISLIFLAALYLGNSGNASPVFKVDSFANDTDISGRPINKNVKLVDRYLRPDRITASPNESGKSMLRFVREIKGVATPISGLEFNVSSNGKILAVKTDANGLVELSICAPGKVATFTLDLENDSFQITGGNKPYSLTGSPACGVDTEYLMTEASDAGQAFGIWQVADRAKQKLEASVGLQFWRNQITFQWPADGDYYSWDTVRLTRGDQWDVVGHEMGHAIYDQANLGAFGGGPHRIDECYSASLALSEGWASFFSAFVWLDLADSDAKFEYMVPRRAPIRIEHIPADVCKQPTNEWRVSGFFWDLVDLNIDQEQAQATFRESFLALLNKNVPDMQTAKARLEQSGLNRELLEIIWSHNFQ